MTSLRRSGSFKGNYNITIDGKCVKCTINPPLPFTLTNIGMELRDKLSKVIWGCGYAYLNLRLKCGFGTLVFNGLALPGRPYGFQGRIELNGVKIGEVKRDKILVFLVPAFIDEERKPGLVEFMLKLNSALKIAKWIRKWFSELCIYGESGARILGLELLLCNDGYRVPRWYYDDVKGSKIEVQHIPTLEVYEREY